MLDEQTYSRGAKYDNVKVEICHEPRLTISMDSLGAKLEGKWLQSFRSLEWTKDTLSQTASSFASKIV